jgi:hypothetical protein
MNYKLNKRGMFVDKIKIEYKSGMLKGKVVELRRDIAEGVIKTGKAVEVVK